MDRILSCEAGRSIGEPVRLSGWIHNIRSVGKVHFLILRDRGGLIQAVIDAGEVPEIDVARLGKEYVVDVEGVVAEEPRAPGGAEVRIRALRVLAEAEEPPLEINRPHVLRRTRVDSLLDHRPISLRAPEIRAIFRIQSALIRGFAEHLRSEGFTEIKTPKIVATGTEGGANLFEIRYFERKAFLAQSPQFYKQMMVGSGLERVFEIGPVFRAEKHETSRHINEYVSMDLEMGFIRDEHDVMDMQVGAIRRMIECVAETCGRELALLGLGVPAVVDIPRIPFSEAMDILRREGAYASGNDIDPEGERALCRWSARERGSEFLHVFGYPIAQRPMYTLFREDDPSVSRSFDLLFRGLEVTTGSQRIHRYDLLVERIRAHGYDPADFEYYLQAFRHGMPPHGGLAIGLERFTAQLLRIPNVKLATLFPRDRHRLTP